MFVEPLCIEFTASISYRTPPDLLLDELLPLLPHLRCPLPSLPLCARHASDSNMPWKNPWVPCVSLKVFLDISKNSFVCLTEPYPFPEEPPAVSNRKPSSSSSLTFFTRSSCPAQLPTLLNVCVRGEGRRPSPLIPALRSSHTSYRGRSLGHAIALQQTTHRRQRMRTRFMRI